jgi:hypothetical protein
MTEGARPLTWQGPTLEIAGREYTVRRLGLLDIQWAAKILASSIEFINRKQLASVGRMSVEERGTFILDFIPYAFDEVIDFFASLLGLAPGVHSGALEKRRELHDAANAKRAKEGKDLIEWRDPNEGTIRDADVFPIHAIADVVGALIEHEDVVAFFDSVKKLMASKALKTLTARLSGPSTPSSPVTVGTTPTLLEPV